MKRSAACCLFLAMVMLLWTAYPVSAEIYQYKDESGNTYYTNDPVGIPKQYQKSVQTQGETVTYPDDSAEPPSSQSVGDQKPAATGNQEAEGSEGQEAQAAGQAQQPAGNLSEVDAMRAKETAFNNEFKALQEERVRLDEAMKKARTKDEREEVNAATIDFNNKFKDFSQRRQAFKEEVTQYNEQVRQDMEQKLEQYKAEQAARTKGGTTAASE